MQKIIENAIEKEARKRLARARLLIVKAAKDRKRFQNRTGLNPAEPRVDEPLLWAVDKHFDPVYCIRHRRFLARVIWRKLRSGEYILKPSIRIEILKNDGKKRPIDIFPIPDAAVSNLMFKNISRRNLRYYSAFSFAYRADKTILDAVQRIIHAVSYPTVYVINYDFQSYFDSIYHDYIRELIWTKNYFRLSLIERAYIRAFVQHRYASINDYKNDKYEFRTRGIPQGASMSLFLANAAAHELDLELERRNGNFARFADDSIVLCYSYEDAIVLKEVYENYSKRSGVPLNRTKYLGIRLLSDAKEEMRTVGDFDFLGYRFSRGNVSVSTRKIHGWKISLAKIIYRNLLYHIQPKKGLPFNPKRIGDSHFDWDLVQCINELRRFVYGKVSEQKIQGFLSERVVLSRAQGATAFFALVEKNAQFKAIDGWLLDVLERALKQRAILLRARGMKYNVPSRISIIEGSWYRRRAPPVETQLPSFSRGWRAARKRWLRQGSSGIDRRSLVYGDENELAIDGEEDIPE